MTQAMATPTGCPMTRIREAFNQNRSAMTVQIARDLGVSEADVIRALPDGMSVELDATRWEQILRGFEAVGTVHVITTNNAVTLEAFGQFGNFSTWHDYFNVATKSLDMHIRYKELTSIFAVRKPSHMDGVDTLSVQFFDSRGASAFKVFLTFGGKAPPPEREEQFSRLVREYALKR